MKACTLKTIRHGWNKLKTQTNGKIYHALRLEELYC